ncbi:MAG: hypothetical protein ACOYJ6_17000 [Caulobacterales bacterium]|jgi:hypothetical protein
MPREVDPKCTRKALRLVRKLAEATPLEDYSGWEKEFLDEVGARLDKFGSAFNDAAKGRLDEALSNLQTVKLKEIAAKAAGKNRKPMGWKKKPKG